MRRVSRFAKRIGLALLLCLPLYSCTEASSNKGSDSLGSSSFVPPVTLEDGDGTYDLKENVSNEGGSFSYEIFVRSFCDHDGDGIGDFLGVADKADYLKKMGVGQVWLMPINPSPSYHGYDVSDYFGVNSDYGSLDDFKTMVSTLNASGIKVLIDMVLNHSSDENDWFSESYYDEYGGYEGGDSKADWYCWSESFKTGYSKYKNLYYECRFDSSMPDFNWDSAGFRAEMKKILLYWLGLGVSGFRLDAVKYYYFNQTSKNIAALNSIVDAVKDDYPNAYFVGENWSTGSEYTDYYKSEIDSFFCFQKSVTGTDDTIVSAAKNFVSGDDFTASIESLEKTVKANNPSSVSSYFLSNHDQDRVSKNLTGSYAKVGASLTYLLPGTPWCYYGEEIGLKGTRLTSPDDHSDARRRLPMVWSSSDKTGECDFPESDRPDLEDNEQVSLGADDLIGRPLSLLSHYRKLAEVRNSHMDAFRNGVFSAIPTGLKNIVAYRLAGPKESIVVVTNKTDVATKLDVSGYAGSLLEEIDAENLKPSYQGGILGIGGFSTCVFAAK
ncbi:MAG: alpha-amylase family glycosyl hydrolase [Bacilli bacterium]|jgi:glycosidase|nr:alpha-amylase family glycosyl hydrolase [Bacilli bacterium]